MNGRVLQRGEVRLRTLIELLIVFLIVYAAFQIGPAVKLRVDFLNEMELAANSPIHKSEEEIKSELLEVAEGFGLTVFYEDIYVERNLEEKKTVIVTEYEIHINFWPRFTYVWLVEDQVEGYLL
jgi:hypothetical protein